MGSVPTNSAAKEVTVELRRAELRDCPRLAELSDQLGYKSSPQEIACRLAGMQGSPDHGVFVAETHVGEIAGWIGVFIHRCIEVEPCAEVSGLVVEGPFRSHGIGRRLLERVEEWAREKGCSSVSVRSNVIRDRAHEFYVRSGYEHFKTQKCFRKKV